MGKIISVQSAKGGSGGTTLLTNLAAVYAQDGKSVCIIDAALDPYALAATFGIEEREIKFSFNDYIFGKCNIEDTIINLPLGSAPSGRMMGKMSLILSSMRVAEQARLLREGYDVGLLNDGLEKLSRLFDYFLIDTGSALAEEGLLSMAISDVVIINTEWKYITKPLSFIEIATRLEVPKIFMVLNMVPQKVFDIPISEFRNNFNLPMALVPNSMEIRDLIPDSSETRDAAGVFAISKPDHPITNLFRRIAREILNDRLPGGNMVLSLEEEEIKSLFSGRVEQAGTSDSKLRVFLCHAPQDKPTVRALYQKLLFEGWIDPWLDNEKLLPGQHRELEIEKAMESTDAVIVFLSNNSVNKEGSVQREIRRVLDVAEEKPEGQIFLIPVRLDDCAIPRSLNQWQWADYFEEDAYQKIRKALLYRSQALPRIRSSQ